MASCCPTNIGAVPPSGKYTFQGKEINFGGLNTYAVGSISNKKVILSVLDVFGLSEQIKIGADKLAQAGFTVYLPDFFKGSPLPVESYPPITSEQKKVCSEFFSTRVSPADHLPNLEKVLDAIKSTHGNDVQIGALGYCWGAKLLVTYPHTSEFVNIACCHAAFIDPADARNVHVPVFFLSSKDEDANIIDGFEEEFKNNPAYKQSSFQTYHDMHHGFMSGRADLSNENNKKRYDEGYEKLIAFFQFLMK
ncbi:dienelactone hydrolase family protein [Schizosaccharomyces cryophilus OY26]|uniref:Dienelactone hydrolase family protein n=1 Tax=Schizosaccharomyces cryophilus (strain OY26 / ATCC MYA-4695 / CBS 11777 / NBRC 106824 / NRRL Y48691) TaxID=653667 RepID=S9X8D2_SCHCR|nr:dienelactone hydrolase family protein [Schizosaccharomyces cryophilus OY26]EPY50091.1 dienelactone hydrolase family protein [Schizosaccharomyces cryophilus OY26]